MMMMQTRAPHHTRLVLDQAWFGGVYQALDRLHDDACAGRLSSLSPLGPAEIVGWLEEFIYTAQETIFEIQAAYSGGNMTKAEPFI